MLDQTITMARSGAGFSQREFAADIGVPVGTLFNWEKGRCLPSANSFAKLIMALGVKPSSSALGEAIVHGRGVLGLSQRELAAKLNVPVGTLFNWEKGRCNPSRQNLAAVVAMLGLRPSDIA